MTTNFIGVLLTSTPNYTVNTGFVSQLYDARGAQTISVQSGASLDLVGALGANIFNLHSNASTWQVWRDGSTVILANTNGDRVNLPAQLDAQKIVFADLQTNIRIDTSSGLAQVKMGGLVLSSTPTTITSAALSSGNPNSAQKAPWSLVTNASVGTKSGGYSPALLVSDGSADGTANQAINQAYTNVVVSPDAGKASFTVSQPDGSLKLEVISEGVVTELGTIDSTAKPINMGDKVFYLPQSQDATARAGAVTDWNLNQTKFSNVIGAVDQTYQVDTLNQNIWFTKYFAPYGYELVKVGLNADGNLSVAMAKDIAAGNNSGVSNSSKSGTGQMDGAELPDGRFIFAANNGTSGMEPWISDGTEAGTVQLHDFYSSSSKNGTNSSNPSSFVALGDKVVFTVDVNRMADGTISEKGRELAISDGTDAGTVFYDLTLGSSSSYPQIIGKLNGYLYFSTQTAIYRTSGGEPEKLTDWSYAAAQILGYNDKKAYLTKIDETRGNELWVADLSTRTVSLVKDILPGTGSSLTPHSYQVQLMVGDNFVFTAYKSASEVALFVTDGTAAKTFEIVTANIYQIQALTNDLVVFRTNTGLYSFQIGNTAPSVVTLSDVALAQSFQKDKDQIFYQTNTGTLYVTGGTVATTVKLAEKVLQYKVIAEDAIYFTQTNTNTTNLALWYSDGTVAGTRFIEDLPTGSYDLSNAYGLRTAGTPLPNDTVPPILSSVVVNGTSLTLKYIEDNQLDASHAPANNPFTITGTDATVTAVLMDATAKTVTLTLSKSVLSSDVIKVSYTDPTANNDALAIQDIAGNDAVSFTNRVAINQTPDNVPPVFSKAVVNGNTLTLSYTDASQLDAVNIPAANKFTVGGTTATVSSVAVSASNKTVTLTLSAAVKSSDTITVSYTDPTVNNDAAAIQDVIGYDAISLVNAAVTNQTPVEEVKAPWTLLVHRYGQIYASDGTKAGSDNLKISESVTLAYTREFNVTSNNKYALIIAEVFDSSTQQFVNKAYSIGSSVDVLTLLASGVDPYGSIYKVGDQIVVTDSNDSSATGFVSDGTLIGTKLIPDISVALIDSESKTIWAVINSEPYGNELFRARLTDASPSFSIVKDIYAGASSGIQTWYFKYAALPNGKLVFVGYSETAGSEPWITDGTESGTFGIDLFPSANGITFSSYPSSLTNYGNEVVFTATIFGWKKDNEIINAGQELVFTDGTVSGTHIIDIYPGGNNSSPEIIGEANGLLYFIATSQSGRGIYSTNGTTFTRLADVNSSATRLAWNSNKAFFSVSDSTNGAELWVADFSANTFTLVKDILTGSGSGFSGDVGAFMVGDKLVFKAYTSATQQNLFVSNGTSAGTVQIGTSLGAYAALGDVLVFADGTSISAANVSGSTPVKVELVNASSAVVKMQSDTDQAFFSLANGDLYATKGTTATTVKLASSVKNFKVVADNALYFVVSNTQSTTGFDLWYSDGTSAGTRYVEEVSSAVYSALDTAVAIRTPGTAAPNDIVAPDISGAVVSGTSLTLTFKDDNGLDATNKPGISAFSLSGTDAAINAVAVDATNKTVTLTLSKSVLSSDVIKVSYADPTAGNDTAAIQDASGNDAAGFTNRYVINQTADNVPPLFSKAEVNGNTLTMTYTDASLLDANNIPAANKFTVGGTTATVSSVAVNASNKTVTLTLSAAVKSTDTITVSYTDPTANNDAAAIQDVKGYDTVSLVNAAVTNQTPVEEVKAPWTLLARTSNTIYASDATKTGSDAVTLPNVSYLGDTSAFTVISTNKVAVISAYVYDTAAKKYAYQAYSISGSTVTPSLLASGIDFYGTVIRVGDKLVQTDSNDSSQSGFVTDGTVAGTKVIAALPNGIVDSNSQTIWSRIYSAPYGYELFKIALADASPAATLVKDIYSGASNGLNSLNGALLPNGKLVFQGINATNGYEPWVSDGTDAGTFPIDLNAGSSSKSGSSSPSSFIEFQGRVAFIASVNGWVKARETITAGQELVFSDGTIAGTQVLDVYAGTNSSSPLIIGEANGLLYFAATNANGRGLYSTNGTTFSRLSSISDSANLLAWNANKAFFSLSDATSGAELWVADFSANTFTLVKDILTGSGSGLSGDVGAIMVGDKLVFKAYTSATQQNLFVSNGTSAGTVQIGTSLGAYAALGDVLVFADGTSISAANVSGSTPVKVELVNASSAVVKMQSDTDQAFFSLANGDLYATKGTTATTVKLASSVKNFKVVADNALYFVVSNTQSTTGFDLWYSDGTSAGTRYVEEVSSAVYSALDTAVAIRTPGTAAPNDIVAPDISGAVVSGTSLTLTFKDDNGLDATNKPGISAFSLSGTDAAINAVAVDATNKTVTLTLSKSVLSSDVIKVSYADPTAGNDTAAIQDASGNDAAGFTNRYVINQTADNVPPLFSKAEVNGNTLTMTYTDASLLDANNIPAANKFTVGGTTATVSSVAVNASNKTVTLTLSAAVKSTDTITVSYTDHTANNDAAVIQDVNGYDAVTLTNASVDNLTPVEEVKAPWTLYVANTYNLYVSDGTKFGTRLLTEFLPNASLNGSSFVVNNNNTVALLLSYIYQFDTTKGANKVYGLTGAGTTPIELAKDIQFGYTPIKINNKIILPDNSQTQNGLITDGTTVGTTVIADLPAGIVDVSSQTIWAALNSAPYGRELFKIVLTDFSPTPVIVKDIYPGADSGMGGIEGALLSNGKLVFKANNPSAGDDVWISDGTSSGTFSLDFNLGAGNSYPSSFTEFGTKVAFSAVVNGWVKGADTFTVGRELVMTDGTTAGTNVIDVYTGGNYSSPEIIGEANNLLYFTATSSAGRGIYSTNGSTFTRLADVNSSATRLGWDTSKAFFSVSDSTNGGELWVADFTANTFSLVKDILPGSGSALSGDIGAFMVNGKLVFKAYTSATQQNLFVSNGTNNGTVKIGNTLGAYAALGDTLVFADGNSISASNLSGATPTTVELVNQSSAVVKMQSDIDQAFFSLANGDLYATNGTLNTTVKLASSVKNFKMVADNALYLVTSEPQSTTGYGLWYSDGTVAGTRFIEDAPAEIYAKLDNAVAIHTVGVNV